MFKIGQKVYWRDPVDETSGVYEVFKRVNSEIILIGNGVSEAEVDEFELYPLNQKVVFRKWMIEEGIIALFPEQELEDRPRIVASYQSENIEREAEYDFVMEATIPANKNEYKNLLEELKEAGYDALEIISEPVSLCRLLGTMDLIAQQLITSIYITDFTIHDRKAIIENNAEVPFIWQVRNTGTWIYFFDNPDWRKRLLERIEDYKYLNHENLYFLYDGERFQPVFLKTVLEMASKES